MAHPAAAAFFSILCHTLGFPVLVLSSCNSLIVFIVGSEILQSLWSFATALSAISLTLQCVYSLTWLGTGKELTNWLIDDGLQHIFNTGAVLYPLFLYVHQHMCLFSVMSHLILHVSAWTGIFAIVCLSCKRQHFHTRADKGPKSLCSPTALI